MEIVRVLEADRTAPARARRCLQALRELISVDRFDDVRLVVSELVTNSVLHAGLEKKDRIMMRVQLLPSRVRVEVVDRGRGFPEGTRRRAHDHGRGLPIVDRLADRWGAERGTETRVWAEIAVPN